MIIVQLNGGLGNQMFQYAAGRRLSLARQTELLLDLSQLRISGSDGNVRRTFGLGCFNAQTRVASPEQVKKILYPFGRGIAGKIFALVDQKRSLENRRLYFHEHAGLYDEAFIRSGSNTYLVGYWQSEKYFKPIEEQIRKDLSFRRELDERGAEWAKRIRSSMSICVNVRRADFVDSRVHGSCDVDYFARGVSILRERVGRCQLFIFSDDIEWCRKKLPFKADVAFVSHECAGPNFEQYLHLMTLCSHFVIPNSSFGWWAAWLSVNPEKVVVTPRKWFRDYRISTRDLIPDGWVRI